MNGLPGMEGDFAKGATGGGNVYDTTPSGLGLSPSYLAQGATATASASGGSSVLVHGKRTSNVSTTGTTFVAGVDVLSANLSFTADGTSDYVVTISAQAWSSTDPAGGVAAFLNLDSANAGQFATQNGIASGFPLNARAVFTPAVGAHTVNVRLVSISSGTSSITGGPGGGNTTMPILVTVEKLG